MMLPSSFTTFGFLTIFVLSLTLVNGQEYLPPKNGGSKKKKDEEAQGPAKYAYSYEVQDGNENVDFAHMEKRDGDVTMGTYHVLLPDGRTQTVEYTAGPDGYSAKVTYEGEASFPPAEQPEGKFDGYRYHAASARKTYIRKLPSNKLVNKAKLGGAVVVDDVDIEENDSENET